jgi:hypothetical protein
VHGRGIRGLPQALRPSREPSDGADKEHEAAGPKQLTLLICNYLFVMFKTDRHVSCLTATRNRWPRGMPSTLPSRVPEALGSSLSAAIVEPTGTTASIVPRSAVRMRGRSLACGRFRGERLLII